MGLLTFDVIGIAVASIDFIDITLFAFDPEKPESTSGKYHTKLTDTLDWLSADQVASMTFAVSTNHARSLMIYGGTDSRIDDLFRGEFMNGLIQQAVLKFVEENGFRVDDVAK